MDFRLERGFKVIKKGKIDHTVRHTY